MTCERCGQEHQRCKAHTRAGNPCRQKPMAGQRVCRMHGGMSPNGLAAGARRLAQAEALNSLADVEVTPIDNPLELLAQVTAEAAAAKDHFANLVAELGKDMAFVTGKATIDEQGIARLEQKLDARVALWERFMDRCYKYAADWVRLGFEDRKAQLDDARAALVRAVLVGVLTELGHEIDTPTIHDTLARWLPVLDGEPPPAISA